jgi:hypothetical protein
MHDQCGINDTASKIKFSKRENHRKLFAMQNMRPHEQWFRAALAAFKGISIKNIYVRELSYPTPTKLYKFKGTI